MHRLDASTLQLGLDRVFEELRCRVFVRVIFRPSQILLQIPGQGSDYLGLAGRFGARSDQNFFFALQGKRERVARVFADGHALLLAGGHPDDRAQLIGHAETPVLFGNAETSLRALSLVRGLSLPALRALKVLHVYRVIGRLQDLRAFERAAENGGSALFPDHGEPVAEL